MPRRSKFITPFAVLHRRLGPPELTQYAWDGTKAGFGRRRERIWRWRCRCIAIADALSADCAWIPCGDHAVPAAG